MNWRYQEGSILSASFINGSSVRNVVHRVFRKFCICARSSKHSDRKAAFFFFANIRIGWALRPIPLKLNVFSIFPLVLAVPCPRNWYWKASLAKWLPVVLSSCLDIILRFIIGCSLLTYYECHDFSSGSIIQGLIMFSEIWFAQLSGFGRVSLVYDPDFTAIAQSGFRGNVIYSYY